MLEVRDDALPDVAVREQGSQIDVADRFGVRAPTQPKGSTCSIQNARSGSAFTACAWPITSSSSASG